MTVGQSPCLLHGGFCFCAAVLCFASVVLVKFLCTLAALQTVQVNNAVLARFVQALRICHQYKMLMLLLVVLWDYIAAC